MQRYKLLVLNPRRFRVWALVKDAVSRLEWLEVIVEESIKARRLPGLLDQYQPDWVFSPEFGRLGYEHLNALAKANVQGLFVTVAFWERLDRSYLDTLGIEIQIIRRETDFVRLLENCRARRLPIAELSSGSLRADSPRGRDLQ